jgi:hypothetical protein
MYVSEMICNSTEYDFHSCPTKGCNNENRVAQALYIVRRNSYGFSRLIMAIPSFKLITPGTGTGTLLIEIGMLDILVSNIMWRSYTRMFRFCGLNLQFIICHPKTYIFKILIYFSYKMTTLMRWCHVTTNQPIMFGVYPSYITMAYKEWLVLYYC